jgi:hypothetical protein
MTFNAICRYSFHEVDDRPNFESVNNVFCNLFNVLWNQRFPWALSCSVFLKFQWLSMTVKSIYCLINFMQYFYVTQKSASNSSQSFYLSFFSQLLITARVPLMLDCLFFFAISYFCFINKYTQLFTHDLAYRCLDYWYTLKRLFCSFLLCLFFQERVNNNVWRYSNCFVIFVKTVSD